LSGYEKSAMQRLSETSEVMELWWDSSPLIFKAWTKQMLDDAPEVEREKLKESLKVMFDYDKPAETLFTGVTTNPKLTSKVLKLIPEEVNPIVDKIIKDFPAGSDYDLAWEVYKTITKKGAALYMPSFEKSGHTKGYVSAQVDPRLVTDVRKMLSQGLILKNLSENIMIKCPGSKEGIYVMELLTSLGIPTNATLVFNVPGAIEVAKAVKRGYETGKENGVDFSNWRSVITIMIGRFEGMPEYAESASSAGIELTEELLRWTGIAIAKKAHELLTDKRNGYKSKLLLCSARPGPGEGNVYHLEKVAGGNLVYTLNPEIIADFMKICGNKELSDQIGDPVPEEIMDKLNKIPYFIEGYAEDGIKKQDLIDHPSFKFTREEFSGSMKEIEAYVVARKKMI